jgi:hypothetical protein
MTTDHDPRSLLPEGWAPHQGGHVRIVADPKAPADAAPPPAGIWWVVDRAPEAHMWWLRASDDDALAWVADHPGEVVQGCVQTSGRWLIPASTAVALW